MAVKHGIHHPSTLEQPTGADLEKPAALDLEETGGADLEGTPGPDPKDGPTAEPRAGVTPPTAAAVYAQEGDAFDYLVAGTALGAGDVVILNGLVGIATHPFDIGRTAGLQCEGVFDFVKKAGDVIAQGVTVYYDATNKYATLTSTTNTCLGKCFKAAASGDARVRVKLITVVP